MKNKLLVSPITVGKSNEEEEEFNLVITKIYKYKGTIFFYHRFLCSLYSLNDTVFNKGYIFLIILSSKKNSFIIQNQNKNKRFGENNTVSLNILLVFYIVLY